MLGTFGRPLAGAAVLGPQDVWAFGQDFFGGKPLGARHWNGHRWTAPPSGHSLVAGSGLAANDVWAVGGKQVAHWNGHVWKRTSVASLLPPTTLFVHSALIGVYEQSPASVWAVGSGDRQDEGGPVVVLHFNGHSWSKAAQGGFGNPSQIVPDGSGGLWIPVPFTAGGIPARSSTSPAGRAVRGAPAHHRPAADRPGHRARPGQHPVLRRGPDPQEEQP